MEALAEIRLDMQTLTVAGQAAVAEAQILVDGLVKGVTMQTDAVRALPSSVPEHGKDLAVIFLFAVAFFIFNWGVRLLVQPLVRHACGMRKGKAEKFAQALMEAVFYGGFMCIGAPIVLSQDWVWPSLSWWNGLETGEHLAMRADLKCYYLMYVARYLQLVLTIFLEPRRSDFAAMLVHHVATTAVGYLSYVCGWNHAGAVTMLLFDPADVPLHMAKMCVYISEARKSSIWKFFADRFFEVFAVLFFVTRIPMFGYIIYSVIAESPKHLASLSAGWYACVGLLLTLLALQTFWFGLIVKAVVRMMLDGAECGDDRSDDEEEDTPANKKTN